MYKGHRIIIFLVLFLCLMLTPMLLNVGRASEAPTPSLDTPEINGLASIEGYVQCVESNEFMRAEHMQLLDAWRTENVRHGGVVYTNSLGLAFEASLENTCLSCHSNRTEFCDTCHTYVAVEPECWNCHIGGESLVGS